ncbi:hypothetical protein H0H92_008292, partial [Tricholoma furcatifolium]
MPRKDAPSGPISAQAQQDLVSDGIENFELPKSLVAKIAKSVLPENAKLQKESVLSLVKGSTVFINMLAATAHDVAVSKQHKSISASDVLKALEMIQFGDLVDKLQSDLLGTYAYFMRIPTIHASSFPTLHVSFIPRQRQKRQKRRQDRYHLSISLGANDEKGARRDFKHRDIYTLRWWERIDIGSSIGICFSASASEREIKGEGKGERSRGAVYVCTAHS